MARHGISASGLEIGNHIAMVRDGLIRDCRAKDVVPTSAVAYSFSMWGGYLAKPSETLDWFRTAGLTLEHLHTTRHASAAALRAFAAAMKAE